MYAIETHNLTKSYGKSRGLVSVDLTVEKGDFYGFIGPNGAGKSTLIRTLLGLIKPTSGSASVLGYDIQKQNKEILEQVGYLPGEVNFYSGITVKRQLSLLAQLRGIDCANESARLCDRLDLDPDRKIDALSLGNRKKVGIIAALQHAPELLVLDEPTSGLDPLMQKEFFSILDERNKQGATVFLSSHVLSEVQRYCKKAAVIRQGRLMISDSVQNLGHTGVKRVYLQGVAELPEIFGARDIQLENDSVKFLYSGDAASLISLLSSLPITDFSVTDPDLDEIFLHYYEAKEATI